MEVNRFLVERWNVYVSIETVYVPAFFKVVKCDVLQSSSVNITYLYVLRTCNAHFYV